MKKWIVIGTALIIALLVQMPSAYAQTYELRVLNQAVNGTNLDFDIYILRTGGTALYLGATDLVLVFNSANFTNPVASLEVEGFSATYLFYTVDPTIVAGNRFIVNIDAPTVTTQSNFNSRVLNVSATGNGDNVGRFRISGITTPTGTAGLQWRNVTSNATIVTNFQNATPWNQTNVTDSTGHINPTDISLPVQLASFNASVINAAGNVKLEWSTLTETNNYGFEVQKAANNPENYLTIPGSFIAGHGTTLQPQHYSYIDATGTPGTWYYRLKQTDLDGTVHYSDGILAGPLSSVNEKPLPTEYALDQNFPNPFNPSTQISFALPVDSNVKLEVFNVLGERMASLLDESMSAGFHTVRFEASNLSTGLYFYKLATNGQTFFKKMMFVK